jgi:hypothetical protein
VLGYDFKVVFKQSHVINIDSKKAKISILVFVDINAKVCMDMSVPNLCKFIPNSRSLFETIDRMEKMNNLSWTNTTPRRLV